MTAQTTTSNRRRASSEQGRPSKALGLAALIVGGYFWLEGAKYSAVGALEFANFVFRQLYLPWRLPTMAIQIDWYIWLPLLLSLGALFSKVEVKDRPFVAPAWEHITDSAQWVFHRGWEAWLIWLTVLAADAITTAIGIRNPAPDAMTVAKQIAASPLLATVTALVYTLMPEQLIVFGWRQFRKE